MSRVSIISSFFQPICKLARVETNTIAFKALCLRLPRVTRVSSRVCIEYEFRIVSNETDNEYQVGRWLKPRGSKQNAESRNRDRDVYPENHLCVLSILPGDVDLARLGNS